MSPEQPKYEPLTTAEEENAKLTDYQKLSFLYIEVNLELDKENEI